MFPIGSSTSGPTEVVSRDNIDQEVELVAFCDGFGNIGTGDCSSFVRVGNYIGAGCNFLDKD
jgi:hypothetical protein